MKPTVYIETTIPSYYCDDRPERASDIERTRQWWDEERGDYECFISAVVLDELSAGDYPTQPACVRLIEGLPLLALNDEIESIAQVYQAHKLMPKAPVRDALHLALVSYYRLEFLLTWNCRHLANVNKAKHLEELNARMHLGLPRLVTPSLLRPLEDTES